MRGSITAPIRDIPTVMGPLWHANWPEGDQMAGMAPASQHPVAMGCRMGAGFGRDMMVVLFATTAGFTVSGILSNLYRLLVGGKPSSSNGRTIYLAVMVLAGPN